VTASSWYARTFDRRLKGIDEYELSALDRRIVLKHQDLREQVARIARQMIESGLVTGTSGNVSARTPEGDVLITPSGLDYAQLEPEDVVLVDLEKNVLEGALEPSSETPMHMGIYRARLQVDAIVHTHSRFATTLACLGWEIPPVHYMLTTLSQNGRIPLAPYATYGTEELADFAGEALGEYHNACLLQNHGTITVGDSAEEAFSRTVVLEEMAEIYYRTRIAGGPILLSSEQVEEVATKIVGYGQAKPTSADAS
jgi:L-fuculose-phosphate aldolase